MSIDIPIKSFLYRFSSLTWADELAMQFKSKEDGRRVYLAHALREISGFKISSVEEASLIINQLPTPAIKTIWMLYQTGLPKNKLFSSPDLYSAPSVREYNLSINKEEDISEKVADNVIEDFDDKITQKLLEGAKKAKTIVTPLSE